MLKKEVVILVAVGTGFSYKRGRDALREATISDLVSSASEKEAAVNTWVEEKRSDIATIAAAAPRSAKARPAHGRLVRELQQLTFLNSRSK